MENIRHCEQPHNINYSPNIIQENKSRNDDMGWICSKHGRNKRCTGKSEGKRIDSGIDGRITVKWVLEKRV
jgi:hypothetical protein